MEDIFFIWVGGIGGIKEWPWVALGGHAGGGGGKTGMEPAPPRGDRGLTTHQITKHAGDGPICQALQYGRRLRHAGRTRRNLPAINVYASLQIIVFLKFFSSFFILDNNSARFGGTRVSTLTRSV